MCNHVPLEFLEIATYLLHCRIIVGNDNVVGMSCLCKNFTADNERVVSVSGLNELRVARKGMAITHAVFR